MIQKIGTKLYRDRTREKISYLLPFLTDCGSVLDFGSGDMSMMRELTRRHKGICAHGVDVLDFGRRHPEIVFKKIQNDRIPYIDKSFDVVISYFVFHHTKEPAWWLRECIRVSRKRIIFVEPIWRTKAERPLMCAWDAICNSWKGEAVPLPFSFRSRSFWHRELSSHGLGLVATRDVEPMPAFLPIGRATMFVADKT